MTRPAQCKPGQVFGRWTTRALRGVGGNGEVWEADGEHGEPVALKILTRTGSDGYARFQREVEILKSLPPDAYAVLPVLDDHLPDAPSKADRAWFAMPLATGFSHALRGAGLREIGAAVLEIAATLTKLLDDLGLNHRDVKPANLYFLRGRFMVGDFGLARRPEDPGLTAVGAAVGPYDFLPSEVFLTDEPDWEKVDVHCLAMTLWCTITENARPPRAQIREGSRYALGAMIEDIGEYRDLDRLLARATDEDPDARLSLSAFRNGLRDWLEGLDIREGVMAAYEKSRQDQQRVLRWLVAFAQTDEWLGRHLWDASDLGGNSPVEGLTNFDFSDALESLKDRHLLYGEGDVRREKVPETWINVYPTGFGVDEIEDETVMYGRAKPLLKEIYQRRGIDILELPNRGAVAEIEDLRMPAPEAFFLLHYLKEKYLIDFDLTWSGGGGLLVNVKLTTIGLQHLAHR